jgi:hypothetical protein
MGNSRLGAVLILAISGNKLGFQSKKGKKMEIYSDRLPHRAFLFSPNSLKKPI